MVDRLQPQRRIVVERCLRAVTTCNIASATVLMVPVNRLGAGDRHRLEAVALIERVTGRALRRRDAGSVAVVVVGVADLEAALRRGLQAIEEWIVVLHRDIVKVGTAWRLLGLGDRDDVVAIVEVPIDLLWLIQSRRNVRIDGLSATIVGVVAVVEATPDCVGNMLDVVALVEAVVRRRQGLAAALAVLL